MGSPTMMYQCSLRSNGNVGAYASTPEPLGAPDPAHGSSHRAQGVRPYPTLRRAWLRRARAMRQGPGARGTGHAPGSACAGRVSVSRSAQVTMSFSDTSLCSSPSTCAPGKGTDPARARRSRPPSRARPSAGAVGLPRADARCAAGGDWLRRRPAREQALPAITTPVAAPCWHAGHRAGSTLTKCSALLPVPQLGSGRSAHHWAPGACMGPMLGSPSSRAA